MSDREQDDLAARIAAKIAANYAAACPLGLTQADVQAWHDIATALRSIRHTAVTTAVGVIVIALASMFGLGVISWLRQKL